MRVDNGNVTLWRVFGVCRDKGFQGETGPRADTLAVYRFYAPPRAHSGATASNRTAAACRPRTTTAGRVAFGSHVEAKYAVNGT